MLAALAKLLVSKEVIMILQANQRKDTAMDSKEDIMIFMEPLTDHRYTGIHTTIVISAETFTNPGNGFFKWLCTCGEQASFLGKEATELEATRHHNHSTRLWGVRKDTK
jgi:hypothetical protein